jgi:penicillin-binding protein 1A
LSGLNLKKILIIIAGLGVAGIIALTLLIVTVSKSLPDISTLADYSPPIPTRILSRDNEVLLEMGKESREMIELKKIPQVVVDAFLSAEDSNFYSHKGVDYTGLIRAAWANVKAVRVAQGGSTITQQVAKMIFLNNEKTILRKIKDFMLALEIEKKFSKEEILKVYLNHVYLGGGYYGVKEAFRGYYGKDLNEATPAEAALIAGLLVAPGKYSPYLRPQIAKKRQVYVLQQMFENKKIGKEEFEKSLTENIKLIKKIAPPNKAPYFTDWVKNRIVEKIGVDDFLTKGYVIKTTLDWSLQNVAEKALAVGVRELDKRQGFKGPIGFIEEADIPAYELKNRIKMLNDISTYFIFNADGALEYEFSLTEESQKSFLKNKIELYQATKAIIDEKKTLYFNVKQDNEVDFVKTLNLEKTYEAVVLNVSDNQKMVYVSMAGILGIIPQTEFQWAHKRLVDDKTGYFAPVERPSKILKTGDLIKIKVKSVNQANVWAAMPNDFKQTALARKNEYVEPWKNQKLFLFSLEQDPDAQSALVSLAPGTGEILSMIGGFDFERSKFNRAIQAKRQAGSAVKPIIYATALENGFTPASILLDTPHALSGVDSFFDWKPKNYDEVFKGPITFRQSLEESRNVPTITLLQQVGVNKVINYLDRFGFNLNIPHDLSISLGSFGINLLDMTTVYSAFANGGRKISFKSIVSITDSTGKEISFDEHPKLASAEETSSSTNKDTVAPVENSKVAGVEGEATATNPEVVVKKIDFTSNLKENQVLDPRIAFLMNSLLKGVVQSGTATKAKGIGSFIAGKTGTTNNYVDAWFVGYSPDIVTSVWTGMDDNTTLGYGETGARSALPIWMSVMDYFLTQKGERDFPMPAGIINVRINPQSGKIARPNEANAIREFFVDGTEPGGEFDSNTQVITPEGSSPIIEDDDYYSNQ